MSNVATVIADPLAADMIDPVALAEQAAHYSTAVTQRVGHLVEQMSNAVDTPIDLERLAVLVDSAQVVDLYPRADRAGECDERWNVLASIEIEPDL